MQRNARATVLTAATLLAAGCARSDFALSRNDQSYWQTVRNRKAARVVQAPPPKILPETYFAAARLHETRGQFAEAVTQYRKAIAVNHRFVAAYHRLGVLLGAMGQFAEANVVLAKAVALRPDDAVLRNNVGFQLVMQEDWQGARREFARAVELSPGFARAHINLGMVLSKLGRFDEALEQFSAVLPDPDAYYNLGLMYRSQKRFEDAADAFSTTLTFNPEFTAARRQLEQLAVHLTPPEPVDIVEPVEVASGQVVPEEVELQPKRPDLASDSGTETVVDNVGAGPADQGTTDSAGESANQPRPSTPQFTTRGVDDSPFFEVDPPDDSEPLFSREPVPEKVLACDRVDEGDWLLSDQKEAFFCKEEFLCEDTPWCEQFADAMAPSFSTAPVRKRPQRPNERYVETMEQPCDEDIVGEIRREEAVDSTKTDPVAEPVANPLSDRIVNATPTVPLSDLTEPPAESTVVVAAPRPGTTERVEPKEDVKPAAAGRAGSRRAGVRNPVVRSGKRVNKVLPVLRKRSANKSHARVATARRAKRPIECFADVRPLPVSWNPVPVPETTCENGVAMLRELETHLQFVRAEIECLDHALFEESYRLASMETKERVVEPAVKPMPEAVGEPVVEPVAEVVPAMAQPLNFVELRTPEPAVEEPGEQMIGPVPSAEEPFLVREEWVVPNAEPIKKEPAARLDVIRALPDQDPRQVEVLFAGLLDLCSIVENESRCLEDQERGDTPAVSLAFDPTLDTVLPSYMPFDLLLDVVLHAHSVQEDDDPVCVADPAWCVDEEVVNSQDDSHRFARTASRPGASWR